MEYKKKIQSFRDLDAWKEGHALVLSVYHVTKKFPKDELFALVSQMRRAAVSITSNIAEGFGRTSLKEKVQFYSIAQGSVTELQNQLSVSKDVGYVTSKEFEQMDSQSIKVHKIISGLMKSTKNRMKQEVRSRKNGGGRAMLLLLFLLPTSLFLLPSPASASLLIRAPLYLGLNSGLVGNWSFNQADLAGTVAYDRSGNANNGTLTNGPSKAIGKIGQGLSFDGVDDFVDVTDNSIFDLTTIASYTYSAWLKPNDFEEWNAVWGQENGASGIFFYAHTTSDANFGPVTRGISFGYWRSSGNCEVSHSTDNVLSAGNWYHVVGIYDGLKASGSGQRNTIYVNGLNVTDTSEVCSSGTLLDVSTINHIRIGATSFSGELMDGIIDDVRIYNRALTAQEVKRLYNMGHTN